MNYKAHPTKKSNPNRRSRKGERNTAFRYNRSLRAQIDRARRALRVTNND